MWHPLDDLIFDTDAWLTSFYKLLSDVEVELAEEDSQQPIVIPNGDVTIVPELTFLLRSTQWPRKQ